MPAELALPEFVENTESRCPVVLLLDNSTSMIGAPLEALNEGLAQFKREILNDEIAQLRVEVAVVTFGPVRLHQEFCTVDQMRIDPLILGGDTPMGQAIEYAIQLIEQRKQVYKTNGILYYRPWIFLITDGAPTDLWQEAARKVREGEDARRHLFFAVGIQGADLRTLAQIAPPSRPPLRLDGLKFQELFHWLSASMTRVSAGKVSDYLALPPVGWGQVPS
jgi:uncharacterized protein YegL